MTTEFGRPAVYLCPTEHCPHLLQIAVGLLPEMASRYGRVGVYRPIVAEPVADRVLNEMLRLTDPSDSLEHWGATADEVLHNPSGAMLNADDMNQVAAIVQEHGLYLLSDEVYEHIVFDGTRHESVLRYPQLREHAFVVSSFGKTYHCTGWKLGYCIAPPALTAEFRKVHQYNTFCSFHPAQHAFAAMIEAEPAHYEQLGAFYQAKRDRFRAQLLDTRLAPLPVPGGYFQLVDYAAVSDLGDAEFCRWLTVEHGVAAIPLSPFYAVPPPGQRLARLCFAKNDTTLDAAIERLRRL